MRFMGVLKADKDSEAGVPPSPEFMERMGKFMEEVMKVGVVKSTEGLHPSSKASRIKVANGKVKLPDVTRLTEDEATTTLRDAGFLVKHVEVTSSLTPGTVISTTFFAQRNGARQGAIAGPLVLCGTALPAAGCTPETGTVMKPPAN